jgi:very-short-patch-repair endonuclease
MSLRLSTEQAVKMKLISPEDARTIESASRNAARGKTARTRRPQAPGQKGSVNLQERLFNALRTRLPNHDIRYDEPGLIQGRKFRADIYIAPSTIVEMDGYQFHSDRNTFQSDRRRNNLFAAAGFSVFHTYAKQVHDPEQLAELVELIGRTIEATTPADQGSHHEQT